jgi:hypothetical protein
MTIVPPTLTPVQVPDSVVSYRPVTDITPFTVRAGVSYQALLEYLRSYVVETLTPYVENNFEDMGEEWNKNTLSIIESFNAALATQSENVAKELADTLAEIAANANVTLNDSAMVAVLNSVTSQTITFLEQHFVSDEDAADTYLSKADAQAEYLSIETANAAYQPKPTAFGFYYLMGAGIDLTGVTPSTAAVNAFFAALNPGAIVVTPIGATITLDGPIQLTKKVHNQGPGEWSFIAPTGGGASIGSTNAITVSGDGSVFEKLTIRSNVPTAATGGGSTKQSGIYISASHVRVEECKIVGLQQAVAVSPFGEFYDHWILHNEILNVPGSGDGPGVAGNNGEDRGDGIVTWGASAIIVGNRVMAAPGADARIGIHAEGLPTAAVAQYAYGDSTIIIADNIVSGKFRRGIVDETTTRVNIHDNIISDVTWWGIALIGSSVGSIVHDNIINWTRTSADTQGLSWSPNRCGIMVYDAVNNADIHDNNILCPPNTPSVVLPAGIVVQASSTTKLSQDVRIHHNRIHDPSGGMTHGVNVIVGSTRLKVEHNDIEGFQVRGIYAAVSADIRVLRNRLVGVVDGTGVNNATGIFLDGASTQAHVEYNDVSGCKVGISTQKRTILLTVIGNTVSNASTGIDMYQSSGSVSVALNTFVSVTSKLVNTPTGAVVTGNN